MSFRLRLTVLASLAVAVAIVGASVVVYYTDRHELLSQVDSDLSSSLAVPRLNAVVTGAAGGLLRCAQRPTGHPVERARGSTRFRGSVQGRVAALVHSGAGAGVQAQAW